MHSPFSLWYGSRRLEVSEESPTDHPQVYALLGSCPTMAVGPEAAGSLLLGSAIRLTNQHHGAALLDGDDVQNARLAVCFPSQAFRKVVLIDLGTQGLIVATTGLIAFVAGFVRLGFLDSVLSRPLLRGFISAVGFVIFVDQLIVNSLSHRDTVSY